MGYDERLWPPIWWWPLLLAWTASLGLAIGYTTTTAAGLLVFVAASSLALAATVASADRVRVDASGLHAGRSFLTAECIGDVHALDSTAAAAKRGRDGDARAHLVLRGWVPTAVTIGVVDDADPHPYWYVSTRRPEPLARALRDIGRTHPAS